MTRASTTGRPSAPLPHVFLLASFPLLFVPGVAAAAPGRAVAPVLREHAFDGAIAAAVQDARQVYPVPDELVRAVMRQESGFQPDARSRAGAVGLMQVMPWNAATVGMTVDELRDPPRNVLAGVRLLAVLLKHYRGDVISALVGYNARPRSLGAPIPRNGETAAYVRAVLSYYRHYSREAGRDLPQPASPAAAREHRADALPFRRALRVPRSAPRRVRHGCVRAVASGCGGAATRSGRPSFSRVTTRHAS